MYNIRVHKGTSDDRVDPASANLLARAIKGLASDNAAYWAEVKRCGGALNGCQEWKPSAGLRRTCDLEVRLIFFVKDGTLFVLSAYYRADNACFERAVRRYRKQVFI
jgi:hypothetical protein